MTDTEYIYEVEINWKEGRRGTLCSSSLDKTIDVATPPEFPGGVEKVWSPEHLFISSVSSCFMTTFLAIAEYSKLEFENFSVHAEGKLSKAEDGLFVVSEIVLKPDIVIINEKFADKAVRIMEKSEKACLITRSIKTKVTLESKVTLAALN